MGKWFLRYEYWSATHTMNPLAWPWVIFASIDNWFYYRNHNQDGSPK